MRLTLYHYWRSSSSWRVRWALAHKGIPCDFVPVDLLNGEAEAEEHRRRNPMGYVPALEISAETNLSIAPVMLTESIAMIEFLEELYPKPSLLPGDSINRARIRALAETINAGTQPLQNLNAQFFHSDDAEKRKAWAQHWIREGLAAYEQIASRTAGLFSVGDELSVADLCLIPQCYNARRNDIDLKAYPNIARIETTALQTQSCKLSHPDRYEPGKTPV